METLELVQTFLTTMFVLITFSFVFKENPLYNFVEHMFIGASGGYLLVQAGKNVYTYGVNPLLRGNAIYATSIILSALVFFRLSRKYGWVSRYPIALLMAVGTGLVLRTSPETEILAQIRASAVPLIRPDLLTVFNNVVIVVITIATISYFVFTLQTSAHASSRWLAKLGEYGMMIGFGASMGQGYLTRVSLLIGVVQQYILVEPSIYYAPFIIAALLIVLGKDILMKKKSEQGPS